MSRFVVAIFALLTLSECGFAECHPPAFRKGRDYGKSIYVSINPNDFTLTNLVCIAKVLNKGNLYSRDFSVLFFTSQDAALNFVPGPIEVQRAKWAVWAANLHAGYFMDLVRHEEYLQILPVGYEGDSSYATKLNLPLSAASHCRLEISNRCVFVLGDIDYPADAIRERGSGSVVLRGSIKKNGKVSRISIITSSVSSENSKTLLANAAVRNLATWRLGMAPNSSTIQITYSFAIDGSLTRELHTHVQWALPDRVQITAADQ